MFREPLGVQVSWVFQGFFLDCAVWCFQGVYTESYCCLCGGTSGTGGDHTRCW